jgi:hypothetical protein
MKITIEIAKRVAVAARNILDGCSTPEDRDIIKKVNASSNNLSSQFVIHVPGEGYFSLRGDSWGIKSGRSITRWKKLQSAKAWIERVKAVFPSAVIIELAP